MTPDEVLANVWTLPDCGCWIWAGKWDSHGYGVYEMPNGKKRPAYRIAYEALRGIVEQGLCLDHLCLMKCCVNPDHLEPVTRSENFRRRRVNGPSIQTLNIPDLRGSIRQRINHEICRIKKEGETLSERMSVMSDEELTAYAQTLRDINVSKAYEHRLHYNLMSALNERQKQERLTVEEAGSLLDYITRLIAPPKHPDGLILDRRR